MKKFLMFTFIMIGIFLLSACGDENNDENNSEDNETVSDSDSEQPEGNEQENTSEEAEENSEDDIDNNDSESTEEQLRVTLDSGKMIINLYDNPTSRELLEQLPLTLTFEEFGGFEKLGYTPEELTTEGSPDGYTPERGDFSYFSPWGNITFFYDSHRDSPGLIKLGEIESGVELLDEIDEDFEVTIERIE